jgi:glycosyltransferase involved in cell wall biosynthesis
MRLDRRILIVDPYIDILGPHQVAFRFVHELSKIGLYFVVAVSSRCAVYDHYSGIGIKPKIVPGLDRLRRGMGPAGYLGMFWRSIQAIFIVSRLIRKERIDLVHSVSINCWVGGFAARFSKVLSVYHIHDLTLNSSRLMGFLIGLVLHFFSDKTLCVSRAALDALPLFSWNYPKAVILRNGIDLEEFYPNPLEKDSIREEMGLDPESCVVASFGTLDKRKGQDLLILASSIVTKKLDHVDFLIVGGKSIGHEGDIFYNYLLQLAGAPELKGRLYFTGFRHDISRLMRSVDIIVQPSRIEAGPIVPLEAMATEVPVIATAVGAIPEEVITDINVILVSAEDPEGMADAIISLANDPEKRQSLGRSGRKLVMESFDLKQKSNDLWTIYDELIESKFGS